MMRTLAPLLFVTGAVTLGMELSASRLIEPAFGNNQIVWAALIGLILFCLAAGAWIGGRLADRFPHRRGLDITLTLAAVGVALAPALSRPVLHLASTGIATFAVGLLAGALVAIFLLFAIPGVLLGTAGPWALRLALAERGPDQTGRIAGRLSAVSTAGSLVGTFIPVLWLIPAVGTRWTFYLLSLTLLVVLVVGSLRHAHRWIPLFALSGVLGLALITQPGTPLLLGNPAAGEVIYADESLYNTIVVRQWGSERHLKLNEGIGLHSVQHPNTLLSLGIWDYFLLAPLFRSPPGLPDPATDSLLLIGLAAGTISELYTSLYGPLPITGIELDPQIIQVGQAYFGMTQPNLTAIAADGRRWLADQPPDAAWSVIAVDAYRPPYIPFHLTTVEFFRLVHDHLKPDGVLAINVGRTPTNFTLVDALAATAGQVFPTVYLIDEPGPPGTLGNTLLVATRQPVRAEATLLANAATLPPTLPAELRAFAADAAPRVRAAAPPPGTPILTDDHAPVERIVHSIILDFLTGAN